MYYIVPYCLVADNFMSYPVRCNVVPGDAIETLRIDGFGDCYGDRKFKLPRAYWGKSPPYPLKFESLSWRETTDTTPKYIIGIKCL